MNRIIKEVFIVIKRITMSAFICWVLAWLISIANAAFTLLIWNIEVTYEVMNLTQQILAIIFYVSFWTLYTIANKTE